MQWIDENRFEARLRRRSPASYAMRTRSGFTPPIYRRRLIMRWADVIVIASAIVLAWYVGTFFAKVVILPEGVWL